jgi:large repetitive protein
MAIQKITNDALDANAVDASKIASGAVNKAELDIASSSGVGGMYVPTGSTAQRPGSPVVGYLRYNTDIGCLEQYNTSGWTGIAAPPAISSVSPSTYNGEQGTSFTINGQAFDAGAVVKFISNAGTEYTAGAVTYVSNAQLTATTPQDFTVAQEPFDVKVINSTGLSYTLENCIDCGGAPSWVTSSGTIATVEETFAVSTSVSATDPDTSATITYAVTSGSLPSGVSLNSSTGAITGTAPSVAGDTTYTFTITATDNADNTSARSFSIVITESIPYYDVTSEISGLSVAYVDGVATGSGNNNSVNDQDSWQTDTGGGGSSMSVNNTTSGLNGITPVGRRMVTYYKSSAFSCGGITIFSGHSNTSDPLPAKDVKFYYSADTTDGSNGTWTKITPLSMDLANGSKHSSATNYVGSRTSAIDADHVVLTGNLQQNGGYHAGSSGYVYGGTRSNLADRVYWDPVTAKGIRIEVRTRWGNGFYTNEKPHIAEVDLHGGNHTVTISTQLEDDANTKCYIDMASGRSYNGTATLTDLSGENYNYNTSTGVPSGSVAYASSNGGVLNMSAASLRNASGVRASATTAFSIGCWVKFTGSSSNNGMIFVGSSSDVKSRFFIREKFGDTTYDATVGHCSGSDDYWYYTPYNTYAKSGSYIQSLSNYTTKYHFFVWRLDSNGKCDTSINGGKFQPAFWNANGQALQSGTTMAFGVGGDYYNDNYSSCSYGGWWFYDGMVPYGKVVKEWDRYKTRFGH